MERGGHDRSSEDSATGVESGGYAADISCVCATVWSGDARRFDTHWAPFDVDSRAALEQATRIGAPMWVLLSFSGGWPNWYEPSRNGYPGSYFDRPPVAWSTAEDALSTLSPSADRLFTEVVELLPFVYDLGATRAFAEVSSPEKEERARLFPACGFISVRPDASGRSLGQLEPLRLCVGIVDNLVLTLPHPQLDSRRSLDRSLENGPEPAPDRGLNVPVRYLPSTREIDAFDIADGIALHLGVTCEWVVQLAENELSEAERTFFAQLDGEDEDAGGAEESGRTTAGRLQEASKRLTWLGDILRLVERELAAILLRAPPSGSQNKPGVEPTYEVEARYRAALEKVGSLRAQVRLVGETMASTLLAEQLAVAERQRKKAEEQQEESDQLQRAGTILASFVLGPGLVAAVYGANVSLPAKDTPAALTAMVLFMLGLGLLSGWLLSAFPKGSWRLWLPEWRTADYASLHAMLAAGVTALLVACFAVAVGLDGSMLPFTPEKKAAEWTIADSVALVLAMAGVLAVGVTTQLRLSRPSSSRSKK